MKFFERLIGFFRPAPAETTALDIETSSGTIVIDPVDPVVFEPVVLEPIVDKRCEALTTKGTRCAHEGRWHQGDMKLCTRHNKRFPKVTRF